MNIFYVEDVRPFPIYDTSIRPKRKAIAPETPERN